MVIMTPPVQTSDVPCSTGLSEKYTRRRKRRSSHLSLFAASWWHLVAPALPYAIAYAPHYFPLGVVVSKNLHRCGMEKHWSWKFTDRSPHASHTKIYSIMPPVNRRSCYFDASCWFPNDEEQRIYSETRLFASYGDNHGSDDWRTRRKDEGVKNINRSYDNGGNSYCTAKRNWLERATFDICNDTTDLAMGKWHQAVSLVHAWSQFRKVYPPTAVRMEALLNVLRKAQQRNENIVMDDIEIYNTILNAWTCAALFLRTPPTTSDDGEEFSPLAACSRAKEIVRFLQRHGAILPNEYSFDVVLHTVLKTEGALEARRFLAWMEYLYKTGKNRHAKPSSGDYIQILNEYAKLPTKQSGPLADGFLTHLEYLHDNDPCLELPNTMCYNIALKAWGNTRKYGLSGREIAEQADRILDQMKRRDSPSCRPDKFTYSCR
jgi:hypothetical protein